LRKGFFYPEEMGMSKPYSITQVIAKFGAVRELPQAEIVELIYSVQGVADARDDDSDSQYSDIERDVAKIYAEVLGYAERT
jgi:hypothetical protein